MMKNVWIDLVGTPSTPWQGRFQGGNRLDAL